MSAEANTMVPLEYYLAGPPRNGYSPVESMDWTGVQMVGLGCLTLDGFVPRQLKNAPVGITASHPAILRDGDVLLSRANTRELVGLVGRYRDVGSPCIYPDLMMRLEVAENCLPEFLEIVLRSPPVRQSLSSGAQGTSESMVKISAETVRSLSVPRFSLNEQEAIVEILDAVTEEERAIEASISKQDLLQEGVLRKLLAPQEHWKALKIRDLGEVVTGVTPPSSWDAEGSQASIPLITPTQIVGRGEVAGSSRLISRAHQMRLRRVPALSTLSVCIGFGLGKVAFSTIDCCTNQQINSIIPHIGMDPRFVYLVVSEAMRHARSRAGLQVTPILNKSDFSHIPVRVPDIEEQRRIAKQFWAATEAQLKLGDELTKLRTLKQGLADDLLGDRVRVGDVA